MEVDVMKTRQREFKERRRERFRVKKPEPDGEMLRGAVHKGHTSEVSRLLKAGVDVNSGDSGSGYSPLIMAIQRGHREIVELLVEHGAKDTDNIFKMSAVKTAASSHKFDIMKMLIEKGFDVDIPNYEQRTALMSVCRCGDAEGLVKLLINNGADVNRQSESGKTALAEAIGWNRLELVRILLESGASPTIERLEDGISIEVKVED
jgi:ankyrin repeat protein